MSARGEAESWEVGVTHGMVPIGFLFRYAKNNPPIVKGTEKRQVSVNMVPEARAEENSR